MRNPTVPAFAGKIVARIAVLAILTIAVMVATFRPEFLSLPFLVAMVAMPVALGFAFADAETQGVPDIAVPVSMLLVTEAFCGFFVWFFAFGTRSVALPFLSFAQ